MGHDVGREQGGHRQPASRRLAREHDATRVHALPEQSLIGRASVVDRGRIRVFGGEPVVESDGPDARTPDEVTHQRDGRRRRADDVDTAMEVQHDVIGLGARDGDLDAADAADLDRLLQDIGGHRDLRDECVERGSHRRDIGCGVEPALAQDAIQLAQLFLAHRQSSPRASALLHSGTTSP
jgi:hypothetical protein